MKIKAFLSVLFILFLYGCARNYYDENEKVFYTHLQNNYSVYGDYKTENYDWNGARLFYRKARTIANGQRLMPEEVFRDLDVVDFLSRSVITYEQFLDMRDRMFLVLNNDTAKQEYPGEVADLQFYYDCWILEERHYVKYSQMARCQQGFIDTLGYLEFKLLRLNMTERDLIRKDIDKELPDVDFFLRPKKYVVNFDFDSSVITEEATRVIWNLLRDIDKIEGRYILNVSGHADRVGRKNYNEKLSKRRVDTVKHYLVRNGVQEGMVKTSYLGEIDPRVITRDDFKEELNRRVTITIELVK